MPHNSDTIFDRRQTHNRDALIHALTQVQHYLRRANKVLVRTGQLPREIGDTGRHGQDRIEVCVERLKSMVKDLAEELQKTFP